VSYPPDMVSTALKMLTAMVVVLAGLWAVYFLLKRVLRKDVGNGSKDKLIRVLENSYIGVKKSISLVEVPGAILVLGISSDRICLLTKIEDEKIRDQCANAKGAHMSVPFSDLLHKFSSRFKTDKDETGAAL